MSLDKTRQLLDKTQNTNQETNDMTKTNTTNLDTNSTNSTKENEMNNTNTTASSILFSMMEEDFEEVIKEDVAIESHKSIEDILKEKGYVSLCSQVTSTIYKCMEKPCAQVATLAGAACIEAYEMCHNQDDPNSFLFYVESTMKVSSLTSYQWIENKKEETPLNPDWDWEQVKEAIIKAKLANEDESIGEKLEEWVYSKKLSYTPILAGTTFDRRFENYDLPKGATLSPLLESTIELQEQCLFTTDQRVLAWAYKVQELTGGVEKDKAPYVLAGSALLDPNKAYHLEFKFDPRYRSYSARYFGPNGAGDDRARALMDFWGVVYGPEHVEYIIHHLKNEMMDMVNVPRGKMPALIREAMENPPEFIASQERLEKSDRRASKPWSFCKAAYIYVELFKWKKDNNHPLPYIGMAFGKDAKCSGPQIAALSVGDGSLAAACGFSLKKIEDAYERAIKELVKAGFNVGKEHRNHIKKLFMAIFYGQQVGKLLNLHHLKKEELGKLIPIIYPDGVIDPERAKLFHYAIVKSFGDKINELRKRFNDFKGRIGSGIGYFLPDGARVEVDCRKSVNILNQVVDQYTEMPNISVSTETRQYRLSKFKIKTNEQDLEAYVRKGFVNMIQAIDALLARLIVVHLGRLGAKHIVSIHDCFRVNVMDIPKLDEAIKCAYMDLFGNNVEGKAKKYLPMGTDFLKLYFEGANESVVPKKVEVKKGEFVTVSNKVTPITQFVKNRHGNVIRRYQKINGIETTKLIKALGEGGSYYFSI